MEVGVGRRWPSEDGQSESKVWSVGPRGAVKKERSPQCPCARIEDTREDGSQGLRADRLRSPTADRDLLRDLFGLRRSDFPG